MKLVPRCMFASLLMLGLTAQAARMSSGTQSDGVTDLTDRLARLGGRILATTPSGASTAFVSGCPNAVTLAQFGFDGSDADLLDASLATDTVPRYAYLGFVGDRLDFAAIASRWAAASALRVFGLRRDKTPDTVVVILLPKTCPNLTAFDWSVLSPWS
jgi:hypothetical protein